MKQIRLINKTKNIIAFEELGLYLDPEQDVNIKDHDFIECSNITDLILNKELVGLDSYNKEMKPETTLKLITGSYIIELIENNTTVINSNIFVMDAGTPKRSTIGGNFKIDFGGVKNV